MMGQWQWQVQSEVLLLSLHTSEEPRALFTHCYGHALNLAASDSVKKCKITFEINKVVKYSLKCSLN